MLKSSLRIFEVIPGSRIVVVIHDQFTSRSCLFEKQGREWKKLPTPGSEEEAELHASRLELAGGRAPVGSNWPPASGAP